MDKHSASTNSNPVGAPTFNTPQAPKQQVERSLLGVNPLNQQFEPTEAMPVRNRFKMGGGA
jgi:hypothetical protein